MGSGTLQIRLRPIRLAFVVPPDDEVALLEAITINTFLWGGMFNPIIPNYRRLPRAWFHGPGSEGSAKSVLSGYLDAFDPDFIVLVGDSTQSHFPVGYRKELKSRDILEFVTEDGTPRYGIGLFEILNDYIAKEARFLTYDKPEACTFNFTKGFGLFLSSVFGKLRADLNEIFLKKFVPHLHAKELDCSLQSYAAFLDSGRLFLRRFTAFHITPSGRRSLDDDCIFFLDATKVLDIIDYWNLRASGRTVIPVPKQAATYNPTKKLVAEFLEENFYPYRHNAKMFHDTTIIKGRSVSDAEFDAYTKALASQTAPASSGHRFVAQYWYPKIWDEWARGRQAAACCDLESRDKQQDISGSTDRVSSRTLDPPFASRFGGSNAPRFANEIELRVYGEERLTAEVLPEGGPQPPQSVHLSASSDWRLSKKGLVYLSRHRNWSITLSPPESEGLFTGWLNTLGWTVELSQAGRTARQLLKQLGGTWQIATLANEELIKLLGDMNESKGLTGPLIKLLQQAKNASKPTIDGITKNIEQLFGNNDERGILVKDALWPRLEKVANSSRFPTNTIAILKSLTAIDAFRLGLKIHCTVCGRPSWYSITDIDYRLRCQKCAERFDLPAHSPNDLKWAYKTFGAFSLPGQADGAYAVLLCLRFFSQVLDVATTPILSFIARRAGVELEADLGLLIRESRFSSTRVETVFCECKTYGPFKDRDVERMMTIADHFPGAVLVFATLRRSLEESEKRRIRTLANKGRRYWKAERPYNPVLVLTGNELFAEFGIHEAWEKVGGKHATLASQFRGLDNLIEVCDATQQLYLDLKPWQEWLHERWERRRLKMLRGLATQQQSAT